MQKSAKNSKILKNYGDFRIPHPQISLKQIFVNMYFIFLLCRGVEKCWRILAKQFNLKNSKLVSFGSFWHFATTTHCNFAFWKIDPPYYAHSNADWVWLSSDPDRVILAGSGHKTKHPGSYSALTDVNKKKLNKSRTKLWEN